MNQGLIACTVCGDICGGGMCIPACMYITICACGQLQLTRCSCACVFARVFPAKDICIVGKRQNATTSKVCVGEMCNYLWV